MPTADGRFRGISVPELPWRPSVAQRAMGMAHSKREYIPNVRVVRDAGLAFTDEQIHEARCIEDGCGRCAS